MLKAEGVFKSFRENTGLWGEAKRLLGLDPEGGVKAVRGVTLEAEKGETLGLVGESGSGKSTLGRIFCSIHQPDKGRVLWKGKDISLFTKKERFAFHKSVQYMFQDPAAALNPRFTAEKSLAEGLLIHGLGARAERKKRVETLLTEVGLDPTLSSRYPHQFSGGQRQRLCLARALSLNPELLIADEPASALDVSVQAQIINLLLEEKRKRGLTLVIISHDLALVSYIADRIAVMYGGLIMEITPKAFLGEINHHPYVKALWASAEYTVDASKDLILEGEPPDPENPPQGCPFRPRCPEAQDICLNLPSLEEDAPGHLSACHFRGTAP
ncbi:MAG: ABC transporter ATP-binding protein [Deltaproteobacteria bacterium]|jgi:oligopeptide/dipeptide ABC transporter ATP-binding protein|nr:ABC transporter ATP-binding protein [Deltaproteobacteria bacterium]